MSLTTPSYHLSCQAADKAILAGVAEKFSRMGEIFSDCRQPPFPWAKGDTRAKQPKPAFNASLCFVCGFNFPTLDGKGCIISSPG